MIVIGNGMLAKAFEASNIKQEGLVLFCSGVSNSRETSANQFNREKTLLLNTMQWYVDKKMVYFSSCAADLIDTPYYQHKKAMEALVESSAERYLIVRLPQVVGLTKNSTLVSFIAENIKSGKPITVFKGARRNLIDVDDVVRLTLVLASFGNLAINVCNGKMVPVEEIVSMIAVVQGVEPILLMSPAEADGGSYDGQQLASLIGQDDPIYSESYNNTVLAKYVPLLRD